VARGQPNEMKKAPTGPKNSNPFVLGFRVDWGGLVGIDLDEVDAKSVESIRDQKWWWPGIKFYTRSNLSTESITELG